MGTNGIEQGEFVFNLSDIYHWYEPLTGRCRWQVYCLCSFQLLLLLHLHDFSLLSLDLGFTFTP